MDENPYKAPQAVYEPIAQLLSFVGVVGFVFCLTGSVQDNIGLKVAGLVTVGFAVIPTVVSRLSRLWRQETRF